MLHDCACSLPAWASAPAQPRGSCGQGTAARWPHKAGNAHFYLLVQFRESGSSNHGQWRYWQTHPLLSADLLYFL